MSYLGENIMGGFVIVGVFVAIIAIAITGILFLFFGNDDTLISNQEIKPRIELKLNNNQLDTLFVYEVK